MFGVKSSNYPNLQLPKDNLRVKVDLKNNISSDSYRGESALCGFWGYAQFSP